MSRLFVLILLVCAVLYTVNVGWRLLMATLREIEGGERPGNSKTAGGGGSRPGGTPRRGETKAISELVPCANCGVHVPRERALSGPGHATYCSDACRSQA